MRGVLFAAAALIAVFAFVRIDFRPAAPAPNPAWAPSEAEGMKIAGPSDDKIAVETTPAPQNLTPPQARRGSKIGTKPPVQSLAAKVPAPAVEPAITEAPPKAAPSPVVSAGDNANDVLDADPPAPGATASGRKPEEAKPLHKRLFRAVGSIFKTKKPDPKVEPSAHHPEQ